MSVKSWFTVKMSEGNKGQSICNVIMSIHYIITSDSVEGKREAANSLLTIDHKNNYLYVTDLGGRTLSQGECDFSLLQAENGDWGGDD